MTSEAFNVVTEFRQKLPSAASGKVRFATVSGGERELRKMLLLLSESVSWNCRVTFANDSELTISMPMFVPGDT